MDLILGTAGHIDHGKTALVQALTGINCDRLEEERRRGITIELGFAWLDLPQGGKLGIVDVPGHERFVKNMVAGASGIDFALLAVAADEGVMPQTREHLDICSLLGVRSGLVALTKVDLVDEELLKLAVEDVKSALAGSFLENAPIVPVSSVSGKGIGALRDEIIRLAGLAAPARKGDIMRLPVDRVFSMKGFGTVVTGTLAAGECGAGEKLCVYPSGKLGRARSLQAHNRQVEQARAGQRCAINLQGLEVEEIRRGDVIARPGSLFPASSWLIRLTCLKSSPTAIRQRMEVHFHHGSRECMAKILLRDREILEPGETGIAEVKFANPLPAIYGDHCILRAHSPLRAIGGGIVINPLPPLLNRRGKDYAAKLALLRELGEAAAGNVRMTAEELARASLELCGAPGSAKNRLKVLTGLSEMELAKALAALEEGGAAYCWERGQGCWIGETALLACLEKCGARAKELHKRYPLKSYFPANELLSGWGENLPEKFTQEALSLCLGKGILEQEGTGLKLAGHELKFGGQDAMMLELLLKKLESGGVAPPFIKEIVEEQGWEIKKVQPLLAHLCESGKILKLQDGVYYSSGEFAKILDAINAWFAANDELDVGNLKTMLGISRKYAIPLLEYLDAIRLTRRVENKRRLRKK